MPLPKRIILGAYQFLDTEPIEHDQYEPGTVKAVFTSPMDEPFVNHYLTVILQPEAQAKIVRHFLSSVMTEQEFKFLLKEARKSGEELEFAADTLHAALPEHEKDDMRKYAKRVIDLSKRLMEWIMQPPPEMEAYRQ